MTQKKTVQPQITHDHAGHAHVNCPGHAPCRLCRIEVDHLSVSAGNQQLLHDVNLHIHCGELTALIGANGAGKTTLIRALLGQVEYKGVIRHLTTDGRPAADVRTGYVPQQLEFDRSSPVTVTDFMAASLSRRPVFLGVSKKTREKVPGHQPQQGVRGWRRRAPSPARNRQRRKNRTAPTARNCARD